MRRTICSHLLQIDLIPEPDGKVQPWRHLTKAARNRYLSVDYSDIIREIEGLWQEKHRIMSATSG